MTPRRVLVSPEAKDDLLAIHNWIADVGSPVNALRFVEKIEGFCLGLAVASERGTRLRQYGRRYVRAVGFRRQATILFRIELDVVTVLRVFRAGLDWTADSPQDD